jgi:hypothetical protein
MSNGVSKPAPSEITEETSSGRRAAKALAKCAPRLWPISATRRPPRSAIVSTRPSSAFSARSEQSTLARMPAGWGS